MDDSRDDTAQDQGSGDVRFLVDSTAGRLARWLRLIGFDTGYSGAAADYRLVHRARAEGRILLTRRKTATLLPWAPAIHLQSDQLDEQLEQVARRFRPPDKALTRCSICNSPLEDVTRESVRHRVPRFVYNTAPAFSTCPGCGRVYWQGTHYAKIKERWSNLRGGLGPR